MIELLPRERGISNRNRKFRYSQRPRETEIEPYRESPLRGSREKERVRKSH